MVVIRLTRTGKKKQAHYRVVVADSKRFVNSKFISIVGWYNPHTKEIELKKDEILAWLDKGAQPSNTVAKLLKANGVKLPDWVKITEKVSKPKKEPIEKPQAPSVEPPVADAEAEVETEIETQEDEITEQETTEDTTTEETEQNPE